MTTPTHDSDQLLRRWLAAERGSADDAEGALAALFTRLPRPVPSRGFTARVVAAALPAPWVPARWMRWLIAACLMLAALTVASLPQMAAALRALVDPAGAVGVFARAVSGLADSLDGAVAAWRVIANLQRILEIVGTAPPVILATVTAILASALAFHFLCDLLVPKQEPSS